MFYIYTPSGRSFSGSLESLRRIEKSASSAGPRHALIDPLEVAADAGRDRVSANDFGVSSKVVEQYQQLLNSNGEREPIKHAYQIMSTQVLSIDATTTLQQTLSVFREHSFQVMPIINTKREVIGYLARKTLYEYLLAPTFKASMYNKTVIDVFIDQSSKVYSAAPVTDIRRIASVLIDYNLDALPIVDEGGHLIGIVSRTDILKSATSDPPLSLWC